METVPDYAMESETVSDYATESETVPDYATAAEAVPDYATGSEGGVGLCSGVSVRLYHNLAEGRIRRYFDKRR